MLEHIYFVAGEFAENRGSYAGFIEEFSRYASKKGYEVTILCGQVGNEPRFEELPYATVYRFPLPRVRVPVLGLNFYYLALGRKVRKYFSNIKLSERDIIIANSLGALGVLNQRYILRMGQAARTFLKNMEIGKGHLSPTNRIAQFIRFNIQHLMERECVRRAAAFMPPSHETKKLWDRYYNCGNKPYFIPFSCIKFDKFSGGKKLPIPGTKLLFISTAEKVRKGIIYLEWVLPEIFSEYKDLKLIHVGEKFKWNVPEWCKERIISVGRVPWDKMRDYYATADIFVFCSLSEGFPNVILEAMASGLPIVTSDIEGIHEYITHLRDGYIYRRGDIEGLKEGIEFMLENLRRAREMGRNAKKRVKIIECGEYFEELLEFLEDVSKGNAKCVNLLSME